MDICNREIRFVTGFSLMANIEQLRTFLEIAATGNFNHAAENLNVTQSTVSARIMLLRQAPSTLSSAFFLALDVLAGNAQDVGTYLVRETAYRGRTVLARFARALLQASLLQPSGRGD